MDRRTQADKAFLKWCEATSKNVVHIADAWFAAVEWADEHPDLYSVTRKAVEREREHLIKKACEWLFEYNKHQARKFGAKSMMRLPDYTINVGDFRKAMEEEQ